MGTEGNQTKSLGDRTRATLNRTEDKSAVLSPQQDLRYNVGGAVNTLTQTGTALCTCPPSECH